MQNKNNIGIKTVVFWLAPTVNELIWYTFFAILTLVFSNVNGIREFLNTPDNLNLRADALNGLNNFLEKYLGVQMARTGVVVVFWAIVGLIVYAFIWVLLNFSDELTNDLAITKYVHPKNIDTSSPLKDFLSRSFFRLVIAILGILYLGLFASIILPYCVSLYHKAIADWFSFYSIKTLLIAIVSQVLAFHVFTILLRLIMLKKRVFN